MNDPLRNSFIGPQLPPRDELSTENSIDHKELENKIIGPQLPPHLIKNETDKDHNLQIEDIKIGPQLPPHLIKSADKSKNIGPELPPHIKPDDEQEEENECESFGPLPPGIATSSKASIALEERALMLQMDQLVERKSDETNVREEWMLELPEIKAPQGVTARQFKTKLGPDVSDRSSWTETPDSKKKKKHDVDFKKEAEMMKSKKRDKEQEKMAKKQRRKATSLMQIHQEKMKNSKASESSERRPFSREIDLQVNKFDETKKKHILKKSQLLDTRFSSGASKFL